MKLNRKVNFMIVIGLTGNSGSGKSAVSNIIKKNNAYIIDADKIAHNIMKEGQSAYNEIVQEFGNEILFKDRKINRKALASIVFNNEEKLIKLNKITHKYILKAIIKKIKSIKKKYKSFNYIVIDAPLLIETGLNNKCDFVWLVNADIEKRIERVIKRDNISREKAIERFKNQTPFEELKKYANVIIENNTDDINFISDIVEKELKKLC